MSYKEDCIQRKNVREGITESKPIKGKKKEIALDWLVVFLCYYNNKWNVLGNYKNEEDARKQMSKINNFWYGFVVEKSIFETYYKGNTF